MAWCCSNPDHGDLAMSQALNRSTSLPVQESSLQRSQMNTPQERRKVRPEK
jgi:hypothetical protein